MGGREGVRVGRKEGVLEGKRGKGWNGWRV